MAEPTAQCAHEHTTLGRSISADGAQRVWMRCDACGENTGGPGKWIPHVEVGTPLDALPVFDSYREQRPPCQRCGRWGTQLHHFFPVYVQGRSEADLWPTAWLCQECHGRWHQLVDSGRPF
jgi:hypothetical protein